MSELIDNRAHRISVLKEIIQHLHAGAAPELVKEQLRKIVGETDATEIMAMEQQLMAEGMPVEEVRSMCDLHSQVTRDVLVQLAPPPSIEPGHPLDTFRRENAALKEVITTMRGTSARSLAHLSDAEMLSSKAVARCDHAGSLEQNSGVPRSKELCACCPIVGSLPSSIHADGVSARSGYQLSDYLLRFESPCAGVVSGRG